MKYTMVTWDFLHTSIFHKTCFSDESEARIAATIKNNWFIPAQFYIERYLLKEFSECFSIGLIEVINYP